MIELLKELKAQQISLGKAHARIAKRLRENGYKSIARGHCIYLGEFRRLAFAIDYHISKLSMIKIMHYGNFLVENRELTAELFAARAHIELLHDAINKGDLQTAQLAAGEFANDEAPFGIHGGDE
ncbi:hypothetical protein [Shewanella algae]|uniref:hypothetical protein n=1 Tax=Shewanella algae TaxID=38313 RepID=UPI001BEDCBB6|nr:hypothetical protein [Shewanella algae]BCV40859.1 hypothetical protein TUM17378_21210 [Shewanella algae]